MIGEQIVEMGSLNSPRNKKLSKIFLTYVIYYGFSTHHNSSH